MRGREKMLDSLRGERGGEGERAPLGALSKPVGPKSPLRISTLQL